MSTPNPNPTDTTNGSDVIPSWIQADTSTDPAECVYEGSSDKVPVSSPFGIGPYTGTPNDHAGTPC